MDRSDPEAIVWDAHACLPLKPNLDLSALDRVRKAKVDYISVNVGMDFNPVAQIMRVIAGYRDWLERNADRYVMIDTVDDVRQARRDGRLGVAFDLEGSVMLEDDLAMVRLYRDLGVRQIHLAYNRDNSIAGGCHGSGSGLTAFGRQVIPAINDAGMLMDCSHSSKRTSLDVMAISRLPVVFSHTCARALVDHPRNVDDEQIKACAATDGVVGITGIGLFLNDPAVRTESLVRHIDHVVQLVGPSHVGLGSDFEFDPTHNDLPATENANDWWPGTAGYGQGNVGHMAPERFLEIPDALAAKGYAADDIAGIMGGNFLRAAEKTWLGAGSA